MKITDQLLGKAAIHVQPAGGYDWSALEQLIESGEAVVGVLGLGYVGLPLALESSRNGFKTIGFDLDLEKVAHLNSGQSYIKDISDDELLDCRTNHNFEASCDLEGLAKCQIIIVAVPTPLNKSLMPDLSAIEFAGAKIADFMQPGTLISLESTTYPGTTEEILLPILEKNGYKESAEFLLVHSPERVDPGNKKYSTKNTPKIIGGVSQKSQLIAEQFYSKFIDEIVPVSDAKTAELVKVYENVFRAVNVAMSNELALLCDRMGINVWEAIEAANTKPFGIMKFLPGPGVGGHCIPLDPHYLEYKAREYHFNTRFITTAGEINRFMPRFVLEKANRCLNELGIAFSRSKILILGVAYKQDIDDYRESPALEIIKLLKENFATVAYHDPFVKQINAEGLKMSTQELTIELVENSDLVIVCTDHSSFKYTWINENSKMILDTRNALKDIKENREKIRLL